MTHPQPPAPSIGRLLLIPNTLDLGSVPDGAAPPDLREVLPLGALQAAARLRHWVAENAKTTRAFLKRVDAICPLETPIQEQRIEVLPRPPKGAGPQAGIPDSAWAALLAPALAGHELGLISEAGLPGVADPGAGLVMAAHRAGVPVLPISGPSSLVLALAGSGLNGQSFAFVGYLPTQAAERAARVRELEQLSRRQRQTQLVIETPYRNTALAQALAHTLHPDTLLCIACGLTLADGWCRTQTVARWRQHALSLPDDIPAVFAWLAA